MQLLLATTNPGKISELSSLLPQTVEIVTPHSFPNASLPQVTEIGLTYFENALLKALRFYETFRVPVLSDDSGLECDALQGDPGVRTSEYWKEKPWMDRWNQLNQDIEKASNVRTARFQAVLCYYDGVLPHFYRGTLVGSITQDTRGLGGFGYDPVFLIPSLGKTLAELEMSEKNSISHRAIAARAFIQAHLA